MKLAFDNRDKEALRNLESKQQVIREAVKQLYYGYDTGLFIWGEGGTGKSFVAEQTLKELNATYRLHNSRMTARGLVDELEKSPRSLHWIEDAETLLEDKKTFGVLRSACWSQSKERPAKRLVTWTAFKTRIEFIFTGSILVISNVNMADESPEIRAIKTRVKVLHVDVTNDELLAMMKQICQDGYVLSPDSMTPEECWEVACFIYSNLPDDYAKMGTDGQPGKNLDLRILKHGFHDFLSYKNGLIQSWQGMLQTRMHKRVGMYKPRALKKAEDTNIAHQIYNRVKLAGRPMSEAVAEYIKVTGKSKAQFYKDLK